jgi:putative transcriptional regulator
MQNKTQRQVADELNVAVSTIAMYETGARVPSLNMARKISNYYGVSIEDIFFKELAHELRSNIKSNEAS